MGVHSHMWKSNPEVHLYSLIILFFQRKNVLSFRQTRCPTQPSIVEVLELSLPIVTTKKRMHYCP